MLYSRKERYKRLLQMAPIVRIFSTLFITMAVISILPFPNDKLISTYIILMVSQLFLILLSLYLFIFGYENFRSKLLKPMF